jgi:hypothetical protein
MPMVTDCVPAAGAAARRFDVCNGDADGLCAVVQWRLHEPADAVLVTGLKREIALLQRVPPGAADEVLVCDLSMLRNQDALLRLLDAGVRVRWFDHHVAPPLPPGPLLDAHLDFAPGICSSLLVDRYLGGRFRAWALVGAYGDDMAASAEPIAEAAGFDASARGALRRLGEAINYNAYGASEADVRIAPAALFARMVRHADPLHFARVDPIVAQIERQRHDDLGQLQALAPHWQGPRGCIWQLPDAAWSRRISGTAANAYARADPARAHAVLTVAARDAYTVSVRAPRSDPRGASAFCERFGGAGREAAAGIDRLPSTQLQAFVEAFAATW